MGAGLCAEGGPLAVICGIAGASVGRSIGSGIGAWVDGVVWSVSGEEPKGGVYGHYDADDELVRAGRTKDFDQRQSQHDRDPDLRDYEFRRIYETDSYEAQRGLEQHVITNERPPLNKINGISPNNPNIDKYMSAAEKYLNGAK